MKTPKTPIALLVVLALFAASCSDDNPDAVSTTEGLSSSTSTTPEAPQTTTTSTTSSTTTSTTAPVAPLVVWIDERLAPALDGTAADFLAATGIPVTIVAQNAEDPVATALEAMEDGTGPDIFIGAHHWLQQLHEGGLVADIPIPNPLDYLPAALAGFTVDGTVYGLPYAMESPVLYYHPGLIPEEPEPGADLTAVCESLSITVRCLGIPSNNPAIHLAIVRAFGGYGFGYGDDGFDPTDIGLDTEGALAAADFLEAQALAGSLLPEDEALGLFAEGREAFLVAGPTAAQGFDRWGAVPYQPPGASDPAVLTTVHGFMINEASTQRLAAQVFLTEFVASNELMFDLYLADHLIPAHTGALEDAVRTDTRLTAFAHMDAGPDTLLPYEPGISALLAALQNAVSLITSQQYTDATPDARAAFVQVAEALRPPSDEG